jgi:hypothetical protein
MKPGTARQFILLQVKIKIQSMMREKGLTLVELFLLAILKT